MSILSTRTREVLESILLILVIFGFFGIVISTCSKLIPDPPLTYTYEECKEVVRK